MNEKPFFRSQTGRAISTSSVWAATATEEGFVSYSYGFKTIEKVSAKRANPYQLLNKYLETVEVKSGLLIGGVGFIKDLECVQKVLRRDDGVYVIRSGGIVLFEFPDSRFKLLNRLEQELNEALLNAISDMSFVEFDPYDFEIEGK